MLRFYLHLLLFLAGSFLCSACRKPDPEPVLPAIPAETKPGTTLTANPDPIVVDDGGTLGETTLSWSTTASRIEVHIDTPDGQLFGVGNARGTMRTGKWVKNGMTFYLQDATNPKPGSADATLGKLQVVLQ